MQTDKTTLFIKWYCQWAIACSHLQNGVLLQIYEYYCQDCFEADTGFIADAACISVCG